jgi:hypothetical protein
VSSVTAVRTFSMSAGLAASTVTPGSTPPELSRTTPATDAWAWAMEGMSRHSSQSAAVSHGRPVLTQVEVIGLLSPRVNGTMRAGTIARGRLKIMGRRPEEP